MLKYTKQVNTCIKLAIVAIAILYCCFLYLDFTNTNIFISTDIIKYLCIILCFSITIASAGNCLAKDDLLLLRIAIFFTLVSDYFLLLKNYFIPGLISFCIVQFIHTSRFSKKGFFNIFIRFSASLIVILTIYLIANTSGIKSEIIFPMALFYFTCLLNSVYFSFYAYKKNLFTYPNRLFMLLGMLLFLMCDINVGLYNIIPMLNSHNSTIRFLYEASSNLIWFFYAPSQLLLSLSGIDFSFCNSLRISSMK